MRAINEHLIGRTIGDCSELQTPALILDRDILLENIAEMHERAARAGKQLRPHVKPHKSVAIARLQVGAGAVGLSCATVREAEVMANAGFDGVLLTSPTATEAAALRLAGARARVPSLMAVVDSIAGLEMLARAATADRPLGILIDIDMGLGRTGLVDPAEVVRTAMAIRSSASLEYRGVQAYYGHLQHVPRLEDRRARVVEEWRKLDRVIAALRDSGYPPEIISGGGTGTHLLDLDEGPFTEIQPGSYIFMDKQYGAVELSPRPPHFKLSLSIAARVVSTVQRQRAILDAGLKAMATEQGPALVKAGASTAASYRFMGDEHGALDFPDGETPPRFGDLVMLVPPHCDPTVNLYDRIHVVQDGRLAEVWPVDARGY